MNGTLPRALHGLLHGIRGTSPYRFLEDLEHDQFLPRQSLLDLQRERLIRLLQHARETCPFYQKRIPTSFSDDHSTEDILARLPIVTKEEVRSNAQDMRSRNVGDRERRFTTSGSTGVPLAVYENYESIARTFGAKVRALHWYNIEFTDRAAIVWGVPLTRPRRAFQSVKDTINNRIRLSAFDLSEPALDRFLGRLGAAEPAYMNGYTSAITVLAERAIALKMSPEQLNVRAVLVTGEILHDFQCDVISQAFGCPVVNEYGGCEVHGAAYTCPYGNLHPSHDNMIVEVIKDGRAAVNSEVGALTITCLWNRAMPLIRYQNGDLGNWRDGSACKCGRFPGLKILDRVVGRSVDFVQRSDGRPIYSSILTYAVRSAALTTQIKEWQAQQWKPGEVEITIVPGADYQPAIARQLQEVVQVHLGASAKVSVHVVERIPRARTGKLRYFVSHMNRGDIENANSSRT